MHGCGAEAGFMSLFVVIIMAMPAFFGAILMFKKWQSSVHLFAIGYVGATIGPFVLWDMKEADNDIFLTAVVTLIIGFAVYIYLCFSKEVRQYFTAK